MRISLDHFYRDRSHLSEKRRSEINFDHPQAIDWKEVERVLVECSEGKNAEMPQYDFATHARIEKRKAVKSKPFIIVDGLWLLRRPSVRRLFSCRVFIDCPRKTCLQRRIHRDLTERNRDASSVRKQFFQHVVPMHERFVASQKRWADIVLNDPCEDQISDLAQQILKTN